MTTDKDLIKKADDVIKRVESYIGEAKMQVIADADARIQQEKNDAISQIKDQQSK